MHCTYPKTQQLYSRYLPMKNKNMCPNKGMYMNTHSSFTPNSPQLEATQMPIHR